MERREFLTIAAASTLTLIPRIGVSQSQTIPNLESTIAALDDVENAFALFYDYELARELGKYVALQFGPVQALQAIEESLRAFPDEASRGLFGTLEDAERRRAIQEELLAQGDPLLPFIDAHIALVRKYSANLQNLGLPSELEQVRRATDSLTHIERIAQVAGEGSPDDAYLCHVFPFSWFC